MKRNFTLFLLVWSTLCFAQPKKFSYLSVQITFERDNNIGNWYYSINSQDSSFIKMYGLREHNPKRDKTIAFFFDRKDSTQASYNCFRSVNEALLFLGEDGWELVSVNNDIQSEGGVNTRFLDTDLPYTKVNAKPVFYFKRPLDE